MGGFIEARRLGKLYREVVAVKLGSCNVFMPDLADTFVLFPPALVVGALSPRTADRDVGPKFAAFEERGVLECWVMDPVTLDHRFYQREGELLVASAEDEEMIRSSAVEGFRMRRSWLDPKKLPEVRPCLDWCLG